MLKRSIISAAIAAFAAAAFSVSAQQQGSITVCKDSTTSHATGKKVCSHHGGVDKDATTKHKAKTGLDKAVTATKTAGENTGEAVGKGARDAANATSKAAGQTGAAVSKGAEDVGKTAKGGAAEVKGDVTNTIAAGAIAKCKDSTFSHATQHQGACAKHGGVDEWLDGKTE